MTKLFRGISSESYELAQLLVGRGLNESLKDSSEPVEVNPHEEEFPWLSVPALVALDATLQTKEKNTRNISSPLVDQMNTDFMYLPGSAHADDEEDDGVDSSFSLGDKTG